MPRFPSRLALALLCALFCLAACAPAATVSKVPTATTPPAPTATSTLVRAPAPTNVPAGWVVLATTHFSIAYPPDWIVQTLANEQNYTIISPTKQGEVGVIALPRADVKTYVTPYCLPESSGARRTTFAHLPMTFELTGLSATVRVWRFANAQQTLYLLSAGDMGASAAIQAQDTAILATFRPDNATPWSC